MSRYGYDIRVQANFNFDWNQVNQPSRDPRLSSYTELIWAGQDDEGWCVFKRNPYSGEIIRIDFYAPY